MANVTYFYDKKKYNHTLNQGLICSDDIVLDFKESNCNNGDEIVLFKVRNGMFIIKAYVRVINPEENKTLTINNTQVDIAEQGVISVDFDTFYDSDGDLIAMAGGALSEAKVIVTIVYGRSNPLL